MVKPVVKRQNILLGEKRCSYERCELCPLFEFCETCYRETCLFENCNQFCGRCPITCHSNPDPEFEEINLQKFQLTGETTTLNFEHALFQVTHQNLIQDKLKNEKVQLY